jgi:hypothetical protein
MGFAHFVGSEGEAIMTTGRNILLYFLDIFLRLDIYFSLCKTKEKVRLSTSGCPYWKTFSF